MNDHEHDKLAASVHKQTLKIAKIYFPNKYDNDNRLKCFFACRSMAEWLLEELTKQNKE